MIWLVTIFKLVPTFDMLMNVYVASWIFTGGAIMIVYLWHMRKLERVWRESADDNLILLLNEILLRQISIIRILL